MGENHRLVTNTDIVPLHTLLYQATDRDSTLSRYQVWLVASVATVLSPQLCLFDKRVVYIPLCPMGPPSLWIARCEPDVLFKAEWEIWLLKPTNQCTLRWDMGYR